MNKRLFAIALFVCAGLFTYYQPAAAAPMCPISNTGGLNGIGGTFTGVGPDSGGFIVPPLWTGDGTEGGEGGWGTGEVVDVAKESLPEPTEPSEEEVAEGQASPEAAGAIVEGLINLIPAIIGATQGGRRSSGRRSSPRSAPRQKCHRSPSGQIHCGSN